jgi:hypothetical protein
VLVIAVYMLYDLAPLLGLAFRASRVTAGLTALCNIIVRIRPAVGPPTFYCTLHPTSVRVGISLTHFESDQESDWGDFESDQQSDRVHFTGPRVDNDFARRCNHEWVVKYLKQYKLTAALHPT